MDESLKSDLSKNTRCSSKAVGDDGVIKITSCMGMEGYSVVVKQIYFGEFLESEHFCGCECSVPFSLHVATIVEQNVKVLKQIIGVLNSLEILIVSKRHCPIVYFILTF